MSGSLLVKSEYVWPIPVTPETTGPALLTIGRRIPSVAYVPGVETKEIVDPNPVSPRQRLGATSPITAY